MGIARRRKLRTSSLAACWDEQVRTCRSRKPSGRRRMEPDGDWWDSEVWWVCLRAALPPSTSCQTRSALPGIDEWPEEGQIAGNLARRGQRRSRQAAARRDRESELEDSRRTSKLNAQPVTLWDRRALRHACRLPPSNAGRLGRQCCNLSQMSSIGHDMDTNAYSPDLCHILGVTDNVWCTDMPPPQLDPYKCLPNILRV